MVLGGTDATAPLWAGLVAEINQGIGRNVGYLNPLLYSKLGPSGIFHSITVAKPGWNAFTGWGSPDGRKLLQEIRRLLVKGT
jgi:kumamolisin